MEITSEVGVTQEVKSKIVGYLTTDHHEPHIPQRHGDVDNFLASARRVEERNKNHPHFQDLKRKNAAILAEIAEREKNGDLPKGTLINAAAAHETENLLESKVDQLTGLKNRRGFREDLTREISRERRAQRVAGDERGLYMVILDNNGLKEINDDPEKGGHDEGDRLLRATADALRTDGRETDAVGRIGGDEFAVLLTDTDPAGAKTWWERKNQLFEEQGIKISAGVSRINPDTIATTHDSIHNADKAMYGAKEVSKKPGGTNQMFYAPS